MRLRLRLLGGFEAFSDSGEPIRLPTRKAEALLAYLAMPAGQSHQRDKLAALLWGDSPDAQALGSLRKAVGALREAMSGFTSSPLFANRVSVQLARSAIDIDVTSFEQAVANGSTEALEHAADLYMGDFLEGLRLDERPFEDWRLFHGERLRELAVTGMKKL